MPLTHFIKRIIEDKAVRQKPSFFWKKESRTFQDMISSAHFITTKLSSEINPIVVQCENPFKAVIAFYACLLKNRPAFLISPEVKVEELQKLLKRYNINEVISDQSLPHNMASVYTVQEKQAELPELNSHAKDDDVAIILLTSGTTGKRRAVPVTHKNLLQTGMDFNHFMGLERSTKELILIPLTHSFGLRRLVNQLIWGGEVVVPDSTFNPAQALMLIKNHGCTALSMVPPQARMMLGRFKQDLIAIGKSIQFIELSSSFMSEPEKIELADCLPHASIVMGYGLTEATRSSLVHFTRDRKKLASVGKSMEGIETILLDSEGKEIKAPYQVGEIVVRGHNVVDGYYQHDVDSDNKKFDSQSFATGDLGEKDEEGYLYIKGRADNIINVGGKKVYPNEIENLLRVKFPDVGWVVTAKRDNTLGFVPLLCYVGSDVDEKSVLNYCLEKLEPYKRPRALLRLDYLPKTENGKVKKEELAIIIDDIFKERK